MRRSGAPTWEAEATGGGTVLIRASKARAARGTSGRPRARQAAIRDHRGLHQGQQLAGRVRVLQGARQQQPFVLGAPGVRGSSSLIGLPPAPGRRPCRAAMPGRSGGGRRRRRPGPAATRSPPALPGGRHRPRMHQAGRFVTGHRAGIAPDSCAPAPSAARRAPGRVRGCALAPHRGACGRAQGRRRLRTGPVARNGRAWSPPYEGRRVGGPPRLITGPGSSAGAGSP